MERRTTEGKDVKIVSVVGTRPQLVKLAPIAAELAEREDVEHIIVHTGQHYDDELSGQIIRGLGIPKPTYNLEVGSGTHGRQTAAMLLSLEPMLKRLAPDWVLTYGDTNTTLAAALAAVKLHLRVAHVEAGLRSYNRRMPEEHNRVLTDHASDLLLTPTVTAAKNLSAEGLADRWVHTGDVGADTCLRVRDRLEGEPEILDLARDVHDGRPYVVATLHRPENVDEPERLRALVGALDAIGVTGVKVWLVPHPRLAARMRHAGLALGHWMHLAEDQPALDHVHMVAAIMGSAGVITDSGGLQREAYLLGKPCTTLRTETEWTEALEDGWNQLVPNPWELDPDEWVAIATRPAPTVERLPVFGDGHAAKRVVEAVMSR